MNQERKGFAPGQSSDSIICFLLGISDNRDSSETVTSQSKGTLWALAQKVGEYRRERVDTLQLAAQKNRNVRTEALPVIFVHSQSESCKDLAWFVDSRNT